MQRMHPANFPAKLELHLFCQLHQYDNCVSGRNDAREQRDRGSPLADRVTCAPTAAKSAAWECRLKSCATLADAIFGRGMGGALRHKVTRLDLAELVIG